jgi:hypothetical protein
LEKVFVPGNWSLLFIFTYTKVDRVLENISEECQILREG